MDKFLLPSDSCLWCLLLYQLHRPQERRELLTSDLRVPKKEVLCPRPLCEKIHLATGIPVVSRVMQVVEKCSSGSTHAGQSCKDLLKNNLWINLMDRLLRLQYHAISLEIQNLQMRTPTWKTTRTPRCLEVQLSTLEARRLLSKYVPFVFNLDLTPELRENPIH